MTQSQICFFVRFLLLWQHSRGNQLKRRKILLWLMVSVDGQLTSLFMGLWWGRTSRQEAYVRATLLISFWQGERDRERERERETPGSPNTLLRHAPSELFPIQYCIRDQPFNTWVFGGYFMSNYSRKERLKLFTCKQHYCVCRKL
jgi:hypothetical protein